VNQQIQIPTEIRGFLESLLQDAHMTSLTEEMKEDMVQELFLRLDSFMTSVIINSMPPEHIEGFIQMNEQKKSVEEIHQYLRNKIPNVEELFTNAYVEFRDLYLGNVAVARNTPKAEEQIKN